MDVIDRKSSPLLIESRESWTIFELSNTVPEEYDLVRSALGVAAMLRRAQRRDKKRGPRPVPGRRPTPTPAPTPTTPAEHAPQRDKLKTRKGKKNESCSLPPTPCRGVTGWLFLCHKNPDFCDLSESWKAGAVELPCRSLLVEKKFVCPSGSRSGLCRETKKINRGP
jgi:hypothetical protein